MNKKCFIVILSCMVVLSCSEHYTPKPKGYFRIDMPQKEYKTLQTNCHYNAQIPVYSHTAPDEFATHEPCWMNIVFPAFNAKIHLSYKNIKNNFQILLDDTHTLAYKHSLKANAINEKYYAFPEHKVYGILFEIKGDAASSLQFFLTDSTSHYLRGALYFNNKPNSDSLAPVVQFLKADIIHFIETLSWN